MPRTTAKVIVLAIGTGLAALALAGSLGLPPLTVPQANPMSPEKVALGTVLFNDKRFSSTGDVNCATCHDAGKVFTDSPLKTSEGIRKLKGTRNAPTVVNAAYSPTMFWDGRSPDLEDQALHPFVNPIEMGLPSHEPILKLVRTDPGYQAQFRQVFGIEPDKVTMREVTMAIAAFERTLVSGDSPFDRYWFGKDYTALTEQQVRGLQVFLKDGRCVSCHTIEQDHALFTDGRFHNVGVGINRIQANVPKLAGEFLGAKARGMDVDKRVLSDPASSELGRFAITDTFDDMGSFKTPTLRNIALTGPFMHDGSLATLRDVVEHYNNGGVTVATDRVNDFLSGGIRPLGLTEQQKDDLVAFMEALTSPEHARKTASTGGTPGVAVANCNVKTPAPVVAAVSSTARAQGVQP